LRKPLTIKAYKIVVEEGAEFAPLRLARYSPIWTKNKAGYVTKIEILAEHLMEISRFLIEGRAGADHLEPLIAEDTDETGWILAGRSKTRRHQNSRDHHKGDRDDPCKLHKGGNPRGVFRDAMGPQAA
jgi:hypothetical protein